MRPRWDPGIPAPGVAAPPAISTAAFSGTNIDLFLPDISFTQDLNIAPCVPSLLPWIP